MKMKMNLKTESTHRACIKHIAIQKVFWKGHSLSKLFLEFQILDDENSSQELNDEDVEHLITEGEYDEGQDDEVYSS